MRIEKLLENQTQVQRAKFQHCSLITSSSEAMSVLEPYINPVKEKKKTKTCSALENLWLMLQETRVIFLLTSEAMLRSQVYKFVSIECEGK